MTAVTVGSTARATLEFRKQHTAPLYKRSIGADSCTPTAESTRVAEDLDSTIYDVPMVSFILFTKNVVQFANTFYVNDALCKHKLVGQNLSFLTWPRQNT